jgi:hypothetical protein
LKAAVFAFVEFDRAAEIRRRQSRGEQIVRGNESLVAAQIAADRGISEIRHEERLSGVRQAAVESVMHGARGVLDGADRVEVPRVRIVDATSLNTWISPNGSTMDV